MYKTFSILSICFVLIVGVLGVEFASMTPNEKYMFIARYGPQKPPKTECTYMLFSKLLFVKNKRYSEANKEISVLVDIWDIVPIKNNRSQGINHKQHEIYFYNNSHMFDKHYKFSKEKHYKCLYKQWNKKCKRNKNFYIKCEYSNSW